MKRSDPLDELIDLAPAEVLRELVKKLASSHVYAIAPYEEEGWQRRMRRECFEFLKEHVSLTPTTKEDAEGEAVFALWDELEPDLAELDEYGGGDYDTQDHVGSLLYELSQRLGKGGVSQKGRRALLDEVFPYIRSGNAGVDDELFDVAYAACYEDEDLRDLAQRFEVLGNDWPLHHARDIYRKIGDREKYLALRACRMKYGADYYDLAKFYWESREREKALEVAREGMKKAEGRMDELRAFLAERAKESGDRKGYLELQFEQATDWLTAESYKTFKKLCTKEEWAAFEPRMVDATKDINKDERLKIYMIRKEFEKAVAILPAMRYPIDPYDDMSTLKIAGKLEDKYPEQILAFYTTGLGDLDSSYSRRIYANKAKVMCKVQHMWVDVIKKPEKWKALARKVKAANLRRPAFQEEFAKEVPGWNEL